MKSLFKLFEIFNLSVFIIDKKLTLINSLKISYSRARIFFVYNISTRILELMCQN